MSAIGTRWLLLVSCIVTVVVAAPTSREESSVYRRDAQSPSSETEFHKLLHNLEPPPQPKSLGTTKSPEREAHAAQEEKTEEQPISTKPTTEISPFQKPTEVKRDAQSSSESEEVKTKLTSSTQPKEVGTTKSPERIARAAQGEITGEQSVPTKPTTEISKIQKPEEVKRDAQLSDTDSEKVKSKLTQPEAVSTTTTPERKARVAQEQPIPTKPTTETSRVRTPDEVKREAQSSSESESEEDKIKLIRPAQPQPERNVRALQRDQPVPTIPTTEASGVKKIEVVGLRE